MALTGHAILALMACSIHHVTYTRVPRNLFFTTALYTVNLRAIIRMVRSEFVL